VTLINKQGRAAIVQRPFFPFRDFSLASADIHPVTVSPSETNYFDIKINSLTFALHVRQCPRLGMGAEIGLVSCSLQVRVRTFVKTRFSPPEEI
jgi:hypothetical protein